MNHAVSNWRTRCARLGWYRERLSGAVIDRRDAVEFIRYWDRPDAAFFGVSVDPADREVRGLANAEPGVRFFWDFDGGVSRLRLWGELA